MKMRKRLRRIARSHIARGFALSTLVAALVLSLLAA